MQTFTEAETLADISIDQVHIAQQIALVRLHLMVTGEVHRLLLEVDDAGLRALRSAGDGDEAISPVAAMDVRNKLVSAWNTFFEQYADLLGSAMREAASIPFGTVAVYHRELVLPVVEEENEATGESLRRKSYRSFREQRDVEDGVFTPQLDEIIQAAQMRIYGDGLRLSERIWRLDRKARRDIDRIVSDALANGWSAWRMAEKLEKYLGPGQDCPRWIEDRLFATAKGAIAAGDKTGLLRGDECDGRGVAYNALRLARTEIQAIHHIANDLVVKRMPWIEKEKINLSPDHAKTDMCDDVASGGDNGDGVYPKGEISLPLHPHCMCYKTAELMDSKDFTDRLRGWMRGTESWSAMDEYQRMIGGDMDVNLDTSRVGISMSAWLWETPVNLVTVLWRYIDRL